MSEWTDRDWDVLERAIDHADAMERSRTNRARVAAIVLIIAAILFACLPLAIGAEVEFPAGVRPGQKLKPVNVREVVTVNPGLHSHRCRRCGTVWQHVTGAANASHNCPSCGKTEFDIHQDLQTTKTVEVEAVTSVTVYTTDGCVPCASMKKAVGNGQGNVKVSWVNGSPPAGVPQVFPVATWRDSAGQLRYLTGYHTMAQLAGSVAATK